jgi:hypothetical protein
MPNDGFNVAARIQELEAALHNFRVVAINNATASHSLIVHLAATWQHHWGHLQYLLLQQQQQQQHLAATLQHHSGHLQWLEGYVNHLQYLLLQQQQQQRQPKYTEAMIIGSYNDGWRAGLATASSSAQTNTVAPETEAASGGASTLAQTNTVAPETEATSGGASTLAQTNTVAPETEAASGGVLTPAQTNTVAPETEDASGGASTLAQTNTLAPETEATSGSASTLAQTNTVAPATVAASGGAKSPASRSPVPLVKILQELEVHFTARDFFDDKKRVLASGQLLRSDGAATAAPPCEFCDEIICSCAASLPIPNEYSISQMRSDFLNALIEDSYARGSASVTRKRSGKDPSSLDDRSSLEIILDTSYERGRMVATEKAASDKKQRRILSRGIGSPASISTETSTPGTITP